MHCHFIMDEFANVSLPDDFDKILSVMRSRGVSVSIILQNLAQLKALFEKQWESIIGNVKLTVDGGKPPYIHGEPTQAVATLVFDSDIPKNAVSIMPVSTSYELLSDEDLEEFFNL